MTFEKNLKKAQSIPDIFETVKDAVWKSLKKSRAGLELGLAELGNAPNGFLGAFHQVGSNIIIMNKTPLRRIQETNPELLSPYIFTTLLHEYLHSLGYLDEKEVRELTYEITLENFNGSIVTEMAKDVTKFFPSLIYPEGFPQINSPVEIVKDFDRSSIRYIG